MTTLAIDKDAFREWVNDELDRLLTCPRCGPCFWFDDQRCSICGMERDEQGPAPRRIVKGLSSIIESVDFVRRTSYSDHMTTTTTRQLEATDTGRDLDAAVLKAQMGWGNLAAVSGGRMVRFGASTIIMPVAAGYAVAVTIEGNDTYTVRRVLKRNGAWLVKGEVVGVYSDGIGEIAYRASCFRDGAFGA